MPVGGNSGCRISPGYAGVVTSPDQCEGEFHLIISDEGTVVNSEADFVGAGMNSESESDDGLYMHSDGLYVNSENKI